MRNLRRLWIVLHRWVGLLLGLWIVVAGLSGSIAVWHRELDAWLNPRLNVEPRPGHATASLEDMLAAARLAYPDKWGPWQIEGAPAHPHAALEVRFPNPPEKAGKLFAPLVLAMNPYTAEIVASRYWGETPGTWIYELHVNLLSDRPGLYVVGALGAVMLVLLVTGYILWWPRRSGWRNAFRVRLRAGLLTSLYDLHRVPAAIAGVILVVLTVTGVVMAFKGVIRPAVDHIASVPKEVIDVRVAPSSQPMLPIAEAVRISETVFPGSTLRWVTTPSGPTGTYRIDRRQPGEANVRAPVSRVWIDPYTGEVLRVRDPRKNSAASTFFNVLYPIHNGEVLGAAGRSMVFTTGIVPLLSVVTGTWLWLRRRRSVGRKT